MDVDFRCAPSSDAACGFLSGCDSCAGVDRKLSKRLTRSSVVAECAGESPFPSSVEAVLVFVELRSSKVVPAFGRLSTDSGDFWRARAFIDAAVTLGFLETFGEVFGAVLGTMSTCFVGGATAGVGDVDCV